MSKFLRLVALSSIVLASTTSCREDFGTVISARPVMATRVSNWNSTHWTIQPLWTSHTRLPDGSAIPTLPIPHLPWAGNVSQRVVATATSGAQARPRATVIVGDRGHLTFAPSSLNVSAGTVIAFDFLGLNHTLTQSSLWDPCHRNGGLNTGFAQFNPSNTSGRFVVEYKVVDVRPRWFFCAQTVKRSHCQSGMVFSLNPGAQHVQFLQNALAAVTTTPERSGNVCKLPGTTLATNSSLSTGTVSAKLGASSGVIIPPISSSANARRISAFGALVALAVL